MNGTCLFHHRQYQASCIASDTNSALATRKIPERKEMLFNNVNPMNPIKRPAFLKNEFEDTMKPTTICADFNVSICNFSFISSNILFMVCIYPK